MIDKIKPYFYIYTVYETSDSAFIHDKDTEYYSEKPINKKYDTVAELDKLGYEIYVLDEPFNAKDSGLKNRTDNFAKQNYMATAIRQGRYHRVNIGKLLKQQKENIFINAKDNLKIKKLLNLLQNMGRGND